MTEPDLFALDPARTLRRILSLARQRMGGANYAADYAWVLVRRPELEAAERELGALVPPVQTRETS